MFRNLIRRLAAMPREAFQWFAGALWRFIKKVPNWLYKLAVLFFWFALFLMSGADHLLSNKVLIAAGRLLVAALGLFVFFAIFLFTEGAPRRIANKLLTPFWYLFAWAAWLTVWAESIRNWALRGFAEMTLIFLAIPFVFWFINFWSLSAPIHWFLVGACIVLMICAYFREQSPQRLQRIVLAETVRAVLLPVAFGLALVCWMQVLFNLYDHDVLSIRLIENHIGYLSEQSEKWIDFSLPATIGLTLSLMVLSLIAPRWKAVTRASRAKTVLHAAVAAVACVSSFTFLAQAPFKIQDHQEAKRIEAERKEEGSRGDLRVVAIKSVRQAIQSMPPQEREQFREGMREMLSKLNELAPYREHGRILEALARRTVEAAAADNRNSVVALRKKGPSNSRSPARDEPPGEPVNIQGTVSSELLAGVGSLFSDLLGAATPELKGMAGKFLESLVDRESDHFYEERIRPGLETRLADLLPAATSFTTLAMMRQFSGAAGKNVSVDIAATARKVKEEVQQEEDRVRSQSEEEEAEPGDVLVEP